MDATPSSSRPKLPPFAIEEIERYNLRKEHESKKIDHTTFDTKFSLPIFLKRVEKLNNNQRAAIERVGFGSLLRIPSYTLSKTLIADLIDKWNSRKGTFLIVDREISITPLDIALIMGLRVTGKAVIFQEEEPLLDLETSYISTPRKRKVSVSLLEKRLDRLGGTGDEADFIRTFLLFTFGTFLFPNSSRTVDSRYISILSDLDGINEYAWGLALLENVLTWITARKDKGVQYVGGCLLLLQIWSYEHFDVARPNVRVNSLNFPRACRWEKSKVITRSRITEEFEKLRDDQIIWELQPTSIELEVDIIREVLVAQMDEPQETVDNDSNAKIDSVVDKMNALKVGSSPTEYPSHREEGDLLWNNRLSEQAIEELKKFKHLWWNPAAFRN